MTKKEVERLFEKCSDKMLDVEKLLIELNYDPGNCKRMTNEDTE